MKGDIIRIASSAAVGVSLFALYLAFLGRYAIVVDWSTLSELEALILGTMILRAIILVAIGTKYQLQPLVPIVVFSIEALLIPFLLVLIVINGTGYYAILMGEILTAWFGATALVLTPFTCYWFVKSMVKETTLTSVLVIGALEFTCCYFLAELLSELSAPLEGVSGLGTLIISQIRNDASSGGIPALGTQVLVDASLVLFFIGMLCYFSLELRPTERKLQIPYVLAVPLAGTLIAFFWMLVIIPYLPDILAVLTAPAIITLVAIWGSSRGK
jgi:hypothetical protein